MGRPDPTRAHRQARALDLRKVGSEQVQAEHHANNVDDGVDSADLVELDLIHRGAVDRRLDFRQRFEHPGRAFDDTAWQRATAHDAQHLRQPAMRLILVRQVNPSPRAAQPVLPRRLSLEGPPANRE